jgi:hypothetical protein
MWASFCRRFRVKVGTTLARQRLGLFAATHDMPPCISDPAEQERILAQIHFSKLIVDILGVTDLETDGAQ